MTYAELVTRISENTKVSKADVDSVLKEFTSVTTSQASIGRSVQLPGFGKFEKKTFKPRKVKIFGAAEFTEVSPKPVVRFKPYDGARLS